MFSKAEPPDPSTLSAEKVLLASEGREIPEGALDLAAAFGAEVYVFTITRVWGTSLGLPMPGLLPTKTEWDEQRERAEHAVKGLKKRGVRAAANVVGTRRGSKRIVREAERLGVDAIVMGADPPKPWVLADFMWSQEPYRVRRRAKVPVYLVVE